MKHFVHFIEGKETLIASYREKVENFFAFCKKKIIAVSPALLIIKFHNIPCSGNFFAN